MSIKSAIYGLPRIGKKRELKFAEEKFFNNEISEDELKSIAKEIRLNNLKLLKAQGIDEISVGDFSYYDNVLDAAIFCNLLPRSFKDEDFSSLTSYFKPARGTKEQTALSMKKWFNTNYHYLVPEADNDTTIKQNNNGPLDYFLEAKDLGINAKPTMIGPFTILKLTNFTENLKLNDILDKVLDCYISLLASAKDLGATWFNFDEPFLVTDLTKDDVALFTQIYEKLAANKNSLKLSVQTYFGDIRDAIDEVSSLVNTNKIDAIGLDFLEGSYNLNFINKFNADTQLIAGVINGKNIWTNNYQKTLKLIDTLKEHFNNLTITSSCSLLHVPVTKESEEKLTEDYLKYFSFAYEKVEELKELKEIANNKDSNDAKSYLAKNTELLNKERVKEEEALKQKIASLTSKDFNRPQSLEEREEIQHKFFNLPLLPTTTIGSFPQGKELREVRKNFKQGKITKEEYDTFIKNQIKECIKLQEDLDIDVLVHGEFERNDMVEYFGQNLDGFIFTQYAWVQSYGTRCVKPPVIWSNIKRKKAITVETSVFAQSLTHRRVKGMLTGPVTIYNWSFPREDLTPKESIFEIALAIGEEVLDLEKAGIKIIQIDEAALKEKLPIRRANWEKDYFDFTIDAFKLTNSKVQADTQIHTHMCYSDFREIIKYIERMDADVITFEASRSKLEILENLKKANFKLECGPGVYDIHSPRVPKDCEFENAISNILKFLDLKKVWINPDCGLKTRQYPEVIKSLENMVKAAKKFRKELSK